MLKENTQFKPFIENIKQQISSSQQKALLAVNKELILLYWNIGKSILEPQEKEGRGAKIIDQLAKEIKFTFPEFKFVQAALAQIPWYHNITLLDKVILCR